MCFLRQCCTHCLCPTLWSQCSKTGSVLAMQPLCRSHGWTVVNHYYTQNWGLAMCFLRQCCTHSLCPSMWSQCSKTGSVLAMQFLCRSHGWTVVNHYCTQNWGLTMCSLRQCCTHSLCPTLWPLCSKTGSCGKSLLHTKLGPHHVFFAAMLHSQFVPHIVVTMLQNWLGLGHAAFVQKSWLDCGESLLHTKLGSQHVFFAAMLHSQFVPHIVATVPQNRLGLGHAAFVLKSWLDCGKSLLHTKLGSHTIVVSMLDQQPLCKPWLDCGKFITAMLHSQFVPLIVVTMLQNWLGLGHAAFVQKSWLDCGKSLLHTKLGSHHVFLRQCCTHCLCPTLWSQCSKTGSVLAMQPLCSSHGWTVVNHYYTPNHGVSPQCLFCMAKTEAMQQSHGWTVVKNTR